MKCFVVLVTTPNKRTSLRIMKHVVDGKWAACANRVPGLESRYWWKNRVETAREELLILKTGSRQMNSLQREIRRIHPYSVCEIVALPISRGNPRT